MSAVCKSVNDSIVRSTIPGTTKMQACSSCHSMPTVKGQHMLESRPQYRSCITQAPNMVSTPFLY